MEDGSKNIVWTQWTKNEGDWKSERACQNVFNMESAWKPGKRLVVAFSNPQQFCAFLGFPTSASRSLNLWLQFSWNRFEIGFYHRGPKSPTKSQHPSIEASMFVQHLKTLGKVIAQLYLQMTKYVVIVVPICLWGGGPFTFCCPTIVIKLHHLKPEHVVLIFGGLVAWLTGLACGSVGWSIGPLVGKVGGNAPLRRRNLAGTQRANPEATHPSKPHTIGNKNQEG